MQSRSVSYFTNFVFVFEHIDYRDRVLFHASKIVPFSMSIKQVLIESPSKTTRIRILGRNETTGLRCMGACHPMATLKYIDSVTSFPVNIKLRYKMN